jgi:ABC-type multidrug transport system fused ATPase/permease subunit
VITHRLSTLKNSDKIVFMEKGKIVTIGTHDQLLSSFEPYRQIFKGYLPLPPIKEVN